MLFPNISQEDLHATSHRPEFGEIEKQVKPDD